MKKTTNMRAGFTMVELIFVIVIIGILAAIAMNKMAGTRDDAKVATVVSNAKTVLQDATTFYTSQGETKYVAAKVSDITSVPLFTDTACSTSASSSTFVSGGPYYICDSVPADVVVFTPTSAAPYKLNIKQGASTGAVATMLTSNKAFQALTDGPTGKDYNIGGSTLVQ